MPAALQHPSADLNREAFPMGLFNRFKGALEKTRKVLNTDVRDLLKQGEILTDERLEDFHRGLITTDMGVAAAGEIVEELRKKHGGRTVDLDAIWETVEERLAELLKGNEDAQYDKDDRLSPLTMAESGPTIILVAGVNGVGKTTTIAKLANLLHASGKKVLLAAGDTFRAAAVEQLTMWAERIGVDIVTGAPNSDPASVAFQGADKAAKENYDVAIVDTAGRLQTQANLMQELEKIRRVMGKPVEGAPHEALLVLDATTGQNGINQAEKFGEMIGCTGIILTKLDGTAKGGVVVAIRQKMGFPVKFVGLGEQVDQLEVFDAEDFAKALVAR